MSGSRAGGEKPSRKVVLTWQLHMLQELESGPELGSP